MVAVDPLFECNNSKPFHDQVHLFCRKKRKMTPPYRVILHNDNYNRREYVVKVLMKVIPGMTVDNAVNIMQEAHVNGLSVVIICSQSEAEEHCMSLRGNGLRSSIEPASGGC
jgi:ATP-dependent Clp protease adaptor protein ClpS